MVKKPLRIPEYQSAKVIVLSSFLSPPSCYGAPWKAAGDGQSIWVSITCVRDPNGTLRFWLWPGIVVALVNIQCVN